MDLRVFKSSKYYRSRRGSLWKVTGYLKGNVVIEGVNSFD